MDEKSPGMEPVGMILLLANNPTNVGHFGPSLVISLSLILGLTPHSEELTLTVLG